MVDNKISEDGDGVGLGDFADAGSAWRKREADRLERNRMAQPAKAPGRPKGAINRKTEDFAKFYTERGYVDPLQAMAEFLSSDLRALHAWFLEHDPAGAPSMFKLLKEKNAVATALAPYLHGKAPIKIEVTDDRLPVLVINSGTNQLDQAKHIQANRALSIGRPMVDITPNNINDLAKASDDSLTPHSLTDKKGE